MQVMFPVLQVMKTKDLGSCGHYFLLVLNIRNQRFEVIDSMRSLEDANLKTCCDQLTEAIKQLWSQYHSESEVVIQNYKIVSINAPTQSNM
jgi:Ulp1 family protease